MEYTYEWIGIVVPLILLAFAPYIVSNKADFITKNILLASVVLLIMWFIKG